jgi:ribosomal-protein-alanine N-acetyltransferase
MSMPPPTLETRRLRLRPFTDTDAEDLFAMQSDAYVLRHWDAPPWTDRSSIARFTARCRTMTEDGSETRLAIERSSDGAFIGWCAFNGWSPDFRSDSLGYRLTREAWGRGYATEAARPAPVGFRRLRPQPGPAQGRHPQRRLGPRAREARFHARGS